MASLADDVLERIFKRSDENRLLSVRLRSGQQKVLYRGDLVSGAILASIVQRAKERPSTARFNPAARRALAQDLLDAVTEEFREGEVLPPDDAAEEWLKLLDHHPEQVVGVSSFGGAGRRKNGSSTRSSRHRSAAPFAQLFYGNVTRLFGIETEYGIGRDDLDTMDPVVESMELVRAISRVRSSGDGIMPAKIRTKMHGGFGYRVWRRTRKSPNSRPSMRIAHFRFTR